MKTHKLFRNILSPNQKPDVSGVFRDLEALVLLQNVKRTSGRVLYFLKFQVYICNETDTPSPY